MGDESATTDWNEVGERFNRLAGALSGSWSTVRGSARDAGDDAGDEVRSAMDQVSSSLDRLADAITHAVNDPEVHGAATSAAAGLVQALGSSLEQLGQRLQRDDRDDVAPGSGRPRGTDM